MRKLIVLATAALGLLAIVGVAAAGRGGGGGADLSAHYPDMRTVVPQHLNLVNQQQHEYLRFSNGIANTGPGPWALRPDPPVAEATTTTTAVQEIRSSNDPYKCGEQPKQVTACYTVLQDIPTGTFEFHPAHNHWHIGDVALFEVRKGSPTGPIVGDNSIKTTFCLIDWYKLDDNARTAERTFFSCYTSYQGIQSGWVDQYHQATDGQQVDLTGVPNANDYYLVSTANYAGVFTETNYTNNTAWVKFSLTSDSNGNRKVTVTDHSPCESPGLCGEGSTNR
jgi:Lysyl oxidase